MKWYIEYPIVWIVVFLIYFIRFTPSNDPVGLRLVLSLVMGTFISGMGYAGFRSVKSKEPLKQLPSESEARKNDEYERVPLVQNRVFGIRTFRKKKNK